MIEITNILDVEKHIQGFDAVIFDLDDTLYSEKEYVRSGYRKIAEYFNRPELEEKLWNVFLCGGKSIDEVIEPQYQKEALNIYRIQQPDIHLYDGVSEMMDRIKRSGKKIGIITDGRPEGQQAKLTALDLRVDKIIITDELGGIEYRKPNELSFRIMKERLNLVFERMVYVGDNPKKDFIAPEKLGMHWIWFKNEDGLYYR